MIPGGRMLNSKTMIAYDCKQEGNGTKHEKITITAGENDHLTMIRIEGSSIDELIDYVEEIKCVRENSAFLNTGTK